LIARREQLVVAVFVEKIWGETVSIAMCTRVMVVPGTFTRRFDSHHDVCPSEIVKA
jgi:hypothetical protein